MKKRNPSIELFRCLLMFGIVMSHVVGQAGYLQAWGIIAFDWCVCGFVFISGYFGIKFRPSKAVALVVLAVFCSFFSNFVEGQNVVSSICGVTDCGNYWFLWAYIALMFFAPLLNKAVDACDRKGAMEIVLPMAFVFYVWMLSLCVPYIRDYMPHIRGLQGLGCLSLLPIYLGARFYRKFELSRFLNKRFVWAAMVICVASFAVGLWYYWWITALVLSAIIFDRFQKRTIPNWLGRVAVFMAPSMFSVYLLHFSVGGLRLMRSLETYLVTQVGLPVQVMYWVAGITVFAVCLGVDLVRRLGVHFISGCNAKLFQFVDAKYEALLEKLSRVEV